MDAESAQLVAVEWEDITAYSRTAIPDDFEQYRLRKLTCGLLWKETEEYDRTLLATIVASLRALLPQSEGTPASTSP